jgi:hypothetical protein
MAKKSRRARRKRRDRSTQSTTASPSIGRDTGGVPARVPEILSAADFADEYGYVYNDLKRIAVLAGSFMAILILLAFILR